MIYLVTGMARSGTAAMMRALIMGGIEGNYFEEMDAILAQRHKLKRSDYDPNPYGFFENGFIPAIEAHGMVSNIMLNRFDVPITDPLMAVVMHRDEAERAASLDEWAMETDDWLLGFDQHYQAFRKTHPGANIIDVAYADLVEDPERELERLRGAGWPINVALAAKAIDPALYRHRIQ